MRTIGIRHIGSFSKTTRFLEKAFRFDPRFKLYRYGEIGVEALRSATPKDTGETASKWSYEVIKTRHGLKLCWNNDHIHRGVNIAIILQYGHGTRNGGYVEGRDYINPAIRPVFDELAKKIWKEVCEA